MKPGRNDPCPCGSGLKFKKCCIQQGATPAAAELVAGNEVAAEATSGEATSEEAAANEPAHQRKGLPRANTWELLHHSPAERGPSRMSRKKPK